MLGRILISRLTFKEHIRCICGSMRKNALDLYQKHFVDKADERLGLFVLLADSFGVRSALYPGSFTHLTPAFVFPTTCFVDMDRRAARFFEDPAVLDLIGQRKIYEEQPKVRFHQADFASGFAEADGTYDLLISQYAGFVSRSCKRYLRPNGYLLVNNSHGDASMASLDADYELIAVVNRRGEKFSLTDKDLGSYFVPKKEMEITQEYLEGIKRGVGYKKSAFSYVFIKVAITQ
jgi:hypothetical protein